MQTQPTERASRNQARLADHGLTPGERIDRYVVTSLLGAGGTGVVVRAFDAELDRSVAIKLMKQRRSPEYSRALLREAKSLAQVTHPAIASIYDVGTCEHGVYIVMEHIQGCSLHTWLGGKARSWSEVRSIIVAVGEALAAAHRAGIIHRDLKPANVMLDESGAPHVIDFGLAGAVDVQHGSPVGTRPYMAPEVHLGLPFDERADIFSFSVVLLEALSGSVPYHGESHSEWAACKGSMRPWESIRGLPRHLSRALAKGLAAAPEERYGSMSDLLADLSRQRWSARSNVSIVIIGGLLSFALQEPLGINAECTSLEGRLHQHWSASRQSAVQASLLASGQAHAESTWRGLSRQLDDQSARLQRAITTTCSTDASPRQRACLRVRVAEFTGLVDKLAELTWGDRGIPVELLASEAANLVPPRNCFAAAAQAQPELDPERSEGVRTLLARAAAMSFAGRYTQALELAQSALEEGEDVPAQLLAEAHLTIGRIARRAQRGELAEEALTEAVFQATAADDDYTVALAATDLVCEFARRPERRREAVTWGRLATSALRNIDSISLSQADLLDCQGALAEASGDHESAAELHERAYALRLEHLDPPHLALAESEARLGELAFNARDFSRASAFFRNSLATRRLLLGAEHPEVAHLQVNVAAILATQGRYQAAEATLLQALDVLRGTLHREHMDIAQTLRFLAICRMDLLDFEGARAALDEATELAGSIDDERLRSELQGTRGTLALRSGDFESAVLELQQMLDTPTIHFDTRLDSLINLSHALERIGDCEGAKGAAAEAEELVETHLGDEPRSRNLIRNNLGYAALCGDELDLAGRSFRAVLDAPDDDFNRTGALLGLSQVWLREGRPEAVLARLAGIDRGALDRMTRGRLLWAEAQAYDALGRGEEAARGAHAARALLEREPGRASKELASIREWQAFHLGRERATASDRTAGEAAPSASPRR